jgi:hypothetical protein
VVTKEFDQAGEVVEKVAAMAEVDEDEGEEEEELTVLRVAPREEWVAPEEWRWFTDSPDAGDPALICSVCAEVIKERMPIRSYYEQQLGGRKRVLEARFCGGCTPKVLGYFIGGGEER